MEKIYDLIVIGGGSASLSTGIYAGRAKLSTLIIEKDRVGGQATTTSEIVNYPGVRQIDGTKLMDEMRLQAMDFGVNFLQAEVLNVAFEGDIKIVQTSEGTYKAVAVVLATGATPRKLGFPGEKEFTGRGVAYCSTCDGEFFTDLEVFVIGAGFAAAEEAMFLTRYARKVTVIAREPEFTCAKSIADKVLLTPRVEVRFNTEITEVKGGDMLNYAKFKNNLTNEEFEYHADPKDGTFGIFIFAGYEPQTNLFEGHVERDIYGYVPTNENMETNVAGIYAAGDLRPKILRQIVTAVADGAIAAISVEKYVANKKEMLGITADQIAPMAGTKKEEVLPTQTTPSNTLDGKSKLLTPEIKTQLKGIFSNIEENVTLVSILDPTLPKSLELEDLVSDLADLGDKLQVALYKRGEHPDIENQIHADKYPVVALLDHMGNYSGVKFHGVPGGHELNSLVLAIYNLGGPGQSIPPNLVEQIKAIDKQINIKVAVSLSCHFCPDVVAAAQRMAILNPNIEAEMINLAEFPDLKTSYKLMSVPAIIVNDERVIFGAKKLEELIMLFQ